MSINDEMNECNDEMNDLTTKWTTFNHFFVGFHREGAREGVLLSDFVSAADVEFTCFINPIYDRIVAANYLTQSNRS